jgi:hypothetical protein
MIVNSYQTTWGHAAEDMYILVISMETGSKNQPADET